MVIVEICNNSPRPFRYDWTGILLSSARYFVRTNAIKQAVSTLSHKTLIVCSTMGHPSPDFVVKALSSSESKVDIRHSWSCYEDSRKPFWCGSVALYSSFDNLREAANLILEEQDTIKVLWFPDMINLLTCAERSHKMYGVGFSRISIKGPRTFSKEEFPILRRHLAQYGKVEMVMVKRKSKKFGLIARVDYRFATHAFIAKFHLNGFRFDDLGLLHVEVVETEKERDIRQEVVDRIEEFRM